MSHGLHTASVKGFNEAQKDETPPDAIASGGVLLAWWWTLIHRWARLLLT